MHHRNFFRPALTISLFLGLAIAGQALAGSPVHVGGYVRSNGTYVAPHFRSAPDGNFNNNWSTKGNVNPYTGKNGTRVTPPSKPSLGSSPASGIEFRRLDDSPLTSSPQYETQRSGMEVIRHDGTRRTYHTPTGGTIEFKWVDHSPIGGTK